MKKFLYFVLVSILSFCSVLASDTSTYNSEQKYNYELQKAIYNNWDYKGKESVSAEAGFTILKNGFITDIDIKKTGNDALDESSCSRFAFGSCQSYHLELVVPDGIII